MAPMPIKTSFAVDREIDPLYSGGPVSVNAGLLATSLTSDVQISELETGKRIVKLSGDDEVITAVSLTPDGRHVLTCSRSLLLRTYELPEGKLIRQTKAHESPVISIDTDSTSTLVATGGAEGTVKVWDIKGGFVTHNFKGHGGVISALKFFGRAGGSLWRLASGADDCKIRVWDLVGSKCLAVLDGHSSVIRGLDFSPDGETLLSGSRDQVINTWDLRKKKLKQSIPVYESLESVGFLAEGSFGASGPVIYFGGERNRVRVLDLTTKTEVAAEPEEAQTTETGIQQMTYLESSQSLVTIRTNQSILTHSLSTTSLPITHRIVGQFDEIIDCAYVLDDSALAIASNSEDVHLLDIQTNNVTVLSGHTDIVLTLDRDFSGKFMVTGAKDNTARVWDLEKEACLMTLSGHTESVGAVALPRTPSDSEVPDFILTGAQDRTIKYWEPASSTKRSKWTIKAHEKDINAIDVAPNDHLFASASQDRLCKIWDRETGEVVAVLRGHKRGVWTVKFSAFEKVIATGSGDRSVKLWSMNDYSCLKTFEGHTNSVLNCLFLSTGQQIASAGGDGLVKIWTIRTGECETTLDNHEDRVWSLALSADDRSLVSGGGDSAINFWRDTTIEEQEKAEKTREEIVEKEQTLSNYVQSKDWRNAIALALSLDRPGKLLALFTEVINSRADTDSIIGLHAVDDVVSSLSQAQLARLLQRVRDWNTNAKTSSVAQSILHTILKAYSSEELLRLPDVKTLLDPLAAFGERHYTRVNGLLQESYLLDYTLAEMVLCHPSYKSGFSEPGISFAIFEILRDHPDAVVAWLRWDIQSLPALFQPQALLAIYALVLPALIVVLEHTLRRRYDVIYYATTTSVIIYALLVTFTFSDVNPLNVMRLRFILTYRISQILDHLLRRWTKTSVALRSRKNRTDHYRGWRQYWDLQGYWHLSSAFEQFFISFREPRLDSFEKSYARSLDVSGLWQQEAVHIAWTGMCILTLNLYMDNMIARTLLLAWGIYAYLTAVVFLMTPYSSPPFARPFYAPSVSEFWKSRWHSLLHSPLHTVAYKPVLRATHSKALAVLSTFLLSGIWHAVGFEAVLGRRGALQITLFFVMMGVGVLLDQAIMSRENKVASRLFGWLWVLGLASLALSSLVELSAQELATLFLNLPKAGVRIAS